MQPTDIIARIEVATLLIGILFAPGTYLLGIPAVDEYFGYRTSSIDESNGDLNGMSYVPNPTISIGSNQNFIDLGFPGNGTEEKPYMIEGYNITASEIALITIRNTDVHFNIKNNILNGMSSNIQGDGIHLVNVINGIIENNIIWGSAGSGILAQSSYNITIANNTIHDNGGLYPNDGISLSSNSYNNLVINNTAYNHEGSGINTHSSSNNSISNNIVFNNGVGIFIGDSSENNNVSYNTVYSNERIGIEISGAKRNTLSFNLAYDNLDVGIAVEDDSSYSNLLTNNTVHDNIGNGINLFLSDKNIVDNNSIYNNEWAIRLWDSTENIITRNIVYGNQEGIVTEGTGGSHNNTIADNIIHDNTDSGIALSLRDQCTNNTLVRNTIYNNLWGINLVSTTRDNVIINNTIYNNEQDGIRINFANHNAIANNIIYQNKQWGIAVVLDSVTNTISNNVVYSNNQYGITIDSSSKENLLQFNDFSRNNAGGTQILDDGLNNLFSSNFYDDWKGTGSYDINGDAENQDQSPLKYPNHISIPTLTSPTSENLTLAGNVLISWSPSIDNFDHQIIYSVYYSTDNGSLWTQLASDLTDPSYNLDTNTIPDGSKVILKVQATDEVGFTTEAITNVTYLIANSLHELNLLSITSPTNGGVKSGTIMIEWTEVIDSWDYDLTYNIYYSSDDGTTWVELATSLIAQSFEWDTTTISNGNYLIKVVARNTEGMTTEVISMSLIIENVISTTISKVSHKTGDSETSKESPMNITLLGIFLGLIVFVPIQNIQRKISGRKN